MNGTAPTLFASSNFTADGAGASLPLPSGATRSLFWFCSQPLIESSLILATSGITNANGGREIQSLIRVRDADGAIVNEVTLSHAGLAMFDLASAVLNVKLEGGLRHGTIEVVTAARATMRMFNKGFSRFFEPARPVTLDCAQFAPVTIASHIENLVCLLNTSAQEATVRVRLILSRRNPDTLVSIPAYGARLMSVEREFSEVVGKTAAEDAARAYIRVSLRSDLPIMMQGVEVIARQEGPIGMISGGNGGLGNAAGAFRSTIGALGVGSSGVVQVCPL